MPQCRAWRAWHELAGEKRHVVMHEVGALNVRPKRGRQLMIDSVELVIESFEERNQAGIASCRTRQ